MEVGCHGALRPKLTLAFTQVPGDPVENLTIEADTLSEGLQYGATAGLPSLNKWLENLQETRHKRPKDGSWRLSLGSGSQDLINKVRSAAWSVTHAITLDLLTVLFSHPCSGILLTCQRGRQHPHGVAGVLVRARIFEESCSRRLTARLYCSGTLGLLNRHKVNLIGTQLPRSCRLHRAGSDIPDALSQRYPSTRKASTRPSLKTRLPISAPTTPANDSRSSCIPCRLIAIPSRRWGHSRRILTCQRVQSDWFEPDRSDGAARASQGDPRPRPQVQPALARRRRVPLPLVRPGPPRAELL